MTSLLSVLTEMKKLEPEEHQGMGRPDGWNNFRREGYNKAISDLSKYHLCEEELVEIIAKYHYELGKRMVLDKGKNEKVSPSRELAKAIIANAASWIVKEE